MPSNRPARLGALLLWLPLSMSVQADEVVAEPVVVTATRIATPADQLGSSVTVIDRADIERHRYRTVSQALRAIPGLNVVQLGGPGQQTSVFIRGASSSHTLVLIDGIDIADPSNPSRAVDFANLSLDDVERIEVVRGPQSTLYGSNAIGGVINIVTRRGKAGPSAGMQIETGSDREANEQASFSGGGDVGDVSLELSHRSTNGDSVTPARLRFGAPAEADSNRSYGATLQAGLRPSQNLKLRFVGRWLDSTTGIDPEVGPFDPANFRFNTAEDTDARLDNQDLFLRTEAALTMLDGLWDATASASYTHYDRRTTNDRTDPLRTLEHVHFIGENTEAAVQNDFYIAPASTVTLGVGAKREAMDASGFRDFSSSFIVDEKSHANADTVYAYLQDQFELGKRLFGTAGLRFDHHEDFGGELTWRVTSVYKLADEATRLTASVGTGFRAPSLFELYGYSPNNFGSAYRGNPNLDPETSFGWEVGAQRSLLQDRVTAGLTWFDNRIDGLIQTVTDPSFNQTSENVDKVRIRGVEATLDLNPSSAFSARLTYTLQDLDQNDRTSDAQVLRRPRQQGGLDVTLTFDSRTDLVFELDYVGDRKDVVRSDISAATITVKDYMTAGLVLNYRLDPSWRLFTRVSNLTNAHYEPADGFAAPDRSVLVGTELKL